MAKVDPKMRNLLIFLVTRGSVVALCGWSYYTYMPDTYKNYSSVLSGFVTFIVVWRSLLSLYRRLVLPATKPREYGEWAIVTGSTSGIGKAFAERLAQEGMKLLLISRTEEKLEAQKRELNEKYGHSVDFLCFDFTKAGDELKTFKEVLQAKSKALDMDGGIGMLVNNVGTSNEVPMNLEEFDDDLVDNLLHCNIFSTVQCTRAVLPLMKARKNGCVLNISSGSGNHPTPMLAIYSATKAFITQFSRSLSVECWGTGVDCYVCTPYYVVSNLYKRKTGTLLAPMPEVLVQGTLDQLGKKYLWQGHGYWFHGLLGNMCAYYWGTMDRWKKVMQGNRDRYDARQAESKKES